MPTWFVIAALIVAAAWLPIMRKFLTAWRGRQNPVSLAIAATITVLMYVDAGVLIFWKAGIEWALYILVAVNSLACAHFYLAFYWARKRFPDARP